MRLELISAFRWQFTSLLSNNATFSAEISPSDSPSQQYGYGVVLNLLEVTLSTQLLKPLSGRDGSTSTISPDHSIRRREETRRIATMVPVVTAACGK